MRYVVLLMTATVMLAGCGGGNSLDDAASVIGPEAPAALDYDALVRTTNVGIPHVKADDYASLGYGLGYVQARDNLCVLAEEYLTIAGQRSEFLGPVGTYTIRANGARANNINSDFFWTFLITEPLLAHWKADASPEALQASRGFAAGYSRYVREIKAGMHPGRHLACRDAAWVRGIDLDDMFRRYIRLAVLASSSVFVNEIATASPPTGLGENLNLPSTQELLDLLDPADLPLGNLNIGSNMYALGPEATQNGQSILFGNPHFPWRGAERLYEMHLTLPGELNIFGSSLLGVPAVLIGFNRHFAWSHTVSTAYRFTFYQLTLDPLDPTNYRYEGEFVPMESELVTIKVRQDDGSVIEKSRRMYRSRYGPILELSVSGIPILGWSNAFAYTLRDANLENTRLINQFFEWNRADSLDEFIRLQKEILGVPWVNTAATGPGQPAYYADITVVPNVPDAMVRRCTTILTPVFAQLMPGLPVLDGSKASCGWRSDEDAPAPGIFGPSNLPSLIRQDYVANMNDSYWLTNPAEPLTGYAAIIGQEGTERSLRTRLGILQIERRLDGSDGLPGSKFNLDNLQQIVLDSAVYSAELARSTVLETICPLGTAVSTSGEIVDIGEACRVLAQWDMKANLDSVGAHIWREFWVRAYGGLLPVPTPVQVPPFWTTGFSASNPVHTPRNLNPLNPLLVTAFADAVQRLGQLGIPLDAPLGELQHSGLLDEFIPIFGGLGNTTGTFTVARGPGPTENGYPIFFGNSYIQTVTWEPGCEDTCMPIAEGFLTYSQSTDPASPYFKNQTLRYSNKDWIEFRYTEDQIRSAPGLKVEHLTAP